MSVVAIDTRNRNGVRTAFAARPVAQRPVHRAPAEVPPMSWLYETEPDGQVHYSTQPRAHALGVFPPGSYPFLTNPTGRTPLISSLPPGAANALGPIGIEWLQTHSSTFSNPPVASLPPDAPIATTDNHSIEYGGSVYTGVPEVMPGSSLSPAPVSPPVSSQTSPTPVTQPITPPPAGVALSPGGPAGATSQPGTPVPVSQPTNQSYTDSNGVVWSYTNASGWQPTGMISSPPSSSGGGSAGSNTPGTTVNVQAGTSMWETITTWLQSSTVIHGIPNFFLAAGVGLVGLSIYGGGRRR